MPPLLSSLKLDEQFLVSLSSLLSAAFFTYHNKLCRVFHFMGLIAPLRRVDLSNKQLDRGK